LGAGRDTGFPQKTPALRPWRTGKKKNDKAYWSIRSRNEVKKCVKGKKKRKIKALGDPIELEFKRGIFHLNSMFEGRKRLSPRKQRITILTQRASIWASPKCSLGKEGDIAKGKRKSDPGLAGLKGKGI